MGRGLFVSLAGGSIVGVILLAHRFAMRLDSRELMGNAAPIFIASSDPSEIRRFAVGRWQSVFESRSVKGTDDGTVDKIQKLMGWSPEFLVLNRDGTASYSRSDGEAKGSWTAEGNTISLNLEPSALLKVNPLDYRFGMMKSRISMIGVLTPMEDGKRLIRTNAQISKLTNKPMSVAWARLKG